MEITITHNCGEKRFETIYENVYAYVEYTLNDNVFNIIHTIVPSEIGGKGIASLLVEKAYNYALEQNYALKYSCPYAKKWLAKRIGSKIEIIV